MVTLRFLSVLIVAHALAASLAAQVQPGPTFTVTTADGDNDRSCDVSDCSLLEALAASNANPDPNVIVFDPAAFSEGATIAPIGSPSVTEQVTIDGTANGLTAGDVRIDGSDDGLASTLHLSGAEGSVVRGLTLISSGSTGLSIEYTNGPITVVGNYIGTDLSGTDLGNAKIGISIFDAANVTIGGSAPGEANTIVATVNGPGISITLGEDTRVVGNFVGTNAVGADLGNRSVAVSIALSTGTVVGGAAPGEANTLTFNGGGIDISSTSTGTQVVGNFIGTDASGANMGNGSTGITISGGSEAVIGGTGAGEGNAIAFNSRSGISVYGSKSEISGNSIFNNEGLGIDLFRGLSPGVTPNDPDDTDSGGNGLQNYPVITSVDEGVVSFTLDSTPSSTFRIEAFESDAADDSGFGEGARFIGFATVVTDADGDVSGSISNLPIEGDEVVSLTATGLDGTSEFSRAAGPGPVANEATPEQGSAELRLPSPNPFGSTSSVVVSLAQPGHMRLTLLDVLGREVAVLFQGDLVAGEHPLAVDGRGLSAGSYLLRLEAAGVVITRQIVRAR